MYITDYGLWTKYLRNLEIKPLESGILEPKFLDSILLIYYGNTFAEIKENSDHIVCKWRHVVKHTTTPIPSLMISKNKLYKQQGRTQTILLNILIALDQQEDRIYKQLSLDLIKILDEKFECQFQNIRKEKDA